MQCSVGLYVTGEIVSHYCHEMSCPYGEPPSMQPGYPACQFSSCGFNAAVSNGSDYRIPTRLASTVYWVYPPGHYAQLSSGAYASEWGDSQYVSGVGPDGPYLWTHYSTQPGFVTCAATIEYYVYASWSDGSAMESPLFDATKLIGTGCPGYH